MAISEEHWLRFWFLCLFLIDIFLDRSWCGAQGILPPVCMQWGGGVIAGSAGDRTRPLACRRTCPAC